MKKTNIFCHSFQKVNPIVTGRTRRETCGSMCKALFKDMNEARQRVFLGQAWVFDRRTISNRARQSDNPGKEAVVQERCKQSLNGKAKG